MAHLAILCPKYSVTYSKTHAQSPDPKIKCIAMDVPKYHGTAKSDGGDGYQVLPGAPLASLTTFEFFHPAVDIGNWFEDHGDLLKEVRHAVERYFEENSDNIAGFLSVRLCLPDAEYSDGDKRDVVGVLNVHWSKGVNILKNAEAARKFAEAIFPLRLLLAMLMRDFKNTGSFPEPT
jgi:hypothetical protein